MPIPTSLTFSIKAVGLRSSVTPRRYFELTLAEDDSFISSKLGLECRANKTLTPLGVRVDAAGRVHDLACPKKSNIPFGVMAGRDEDVDKVFRRSDPSEMSSYNAVRLRPVSRQCYDIPSRNRQCTEYLW